MKNLITFCLLFFFNSSFCQIPDLNFQPNPDEQPLKISQVELSIEVVGNVATTTFDITFYNPNSRDLEGELAMPLGDGKEISRYALEVNGKLREGVVVEKIKARQTFEAIVRQKIDPGIVNKTKGNFFKTKIYPIPANGSKRIVLGITETLSADSASFSYEMSLPRGKIISDFNLEVNVIKSHSKDLRPISEFENINFDDRSDVYRLNFERKNYTLPESVRFSIPKFGNSTHQLFTEQIGDKTYFYLHVKNPMLFREKKKQPTNVAIYWDRSHSASNRNLSKELELLDNYLTGLGGTKIVRLISFNLIENKAVQFEIRDDASALLEHIKALANDGATRIDNIKFDNNSDEVLMFTDAVNTIGQAVLNSSSVPVYTIVSSAGANYNLLKQVSSHSNGAFIDLDRYNVSESMEALMYDKEKLISIEYDPMEIEEVYPNIPVSVGDYTIIVGVL